MNSEYFQKNKNKNTKYIYLTGVCSLINGEWENWRWMGDKKGNYLSHFPTNPDSAAMLLLSKKFLFAGSAERGQGSRPSMIACRNIVQLTRWLHKLSGGVCRILALVPGGYQSRFLLCHVLQNNHHGVLLWRQCRETGGEISEHTGKVQRTLM